MNEAEKNLIRTEIEKNLHSLVCVQVKDHIRDFVMLTVRRNQVPVEKFAVEHLIKTTELAIDDAFKRNVDALLDSIVESTEKYSLLVDSEAMKTKSTLPKG